MVTMNRTLEFKCRTVDGGRAGARGRRRALLLALVTTFVGAPASHAVIPAKTDGRVVDAATMQRVYDEVKTPYKYGVVLKGASPEEFLDCPNIFRHEGRWYMMYVATRGKVGYETYLARSDDLLHWEKLGKILPFTESGWDAWQADGGLALIDPAWGGSSALGMHEGRAWLSYIGGAKQGYEPDPLAIGIAWSTTPTEPKPWTRIEQNPVLHHEQPDVRPFEVSTLYKSTIIRDEAESLGYAFVMFYNGKAPPNGHEAIGMAVSRDMITWHRYGEKAVIENVGESRWAISGDPQIVKMGDLWVMFYFGAFWKPNAFDTFACSYDLVTWTKWNGSHLVEPSKPFDKQFAHKPWVVKHEGVVYHFYCAVGEEGRVLALATSRDLRSQTEKP